MNETIITNSTITTATDAIKGIDTSFMSTAQNWLFGAISNITGLDTGVIGMLAIVAFLALFMFKGKAVLDTLKTYFVAFLAIIILFILARSMKIL